MVQKGSEQYKRTFSSGNLIVLLLTNILTGNNCMGLVEQSPRIEAWPSFPCEAR